MKRQKIYFSVRLDTDEELQQVAARVGQALNCTFVRGEFQRWYAEVAYVFGLKISVAGVSGIDRKKVAKLVASVAEKGFRQAPDGNGPVEYERVDISAYMTDLLTIRTGLPWYQPTPEDHAAEGKAAGRFDDWLGGVGSQGWTSADEEKFGDW
ncbi:hypothetical protein SAMN05192558_10962 [Actinokineospora alba]|uniref:Uncharacterized protein n=1 Tax=Actinokineospora alba TaxID=504798 RepID=A0A1H0ST14_9PSEU|nr:hypothetical protein [Actinokineospora alba]TDP66571.1 hypothetical protein C8E96_2082 [Actinokineospora alba]SDJ38041.1 hypothetical protein SAMN05421871_11484 [Actinokineospora alba]SDP44388.1 hypothetical protein SAMN05192558_10962 [Actinokineospora alba]